MNKACIPLAGLILSVLTSTHAVAASACSSVGDDDAQTITSAESEECTVSPVLSYFSVGERASVDITGQGAGGTAVYVTDNNLDSFGNDGTIAATFIGVRIASHGVGADNETHIDDFNNTGLIKVTGGLRCAC